MTPELVALLHAASCWFMTGLIWFVQVVHYPLMAGVGGAGWAAYEASHQRQTTFVVAPVMLLEAACAGLLAWPAALGASDGHSSELALMGLGLLAIAWLSTFLVQVPLHGRLARGFDAAAHRRLVRSNWARTAAWSARAVVASILLV